MQTETGMLVRIWAPIYGGKSPQPALFVTGDVRFQSADDAQRALSFTVKLAERTGVPLPVKEHAGAQVIAERAHHMVNVLAVKGDRMTFGSYADVARKSKRPFPATQAMVDKAVEQASVEGDFGTLPPFGQDLAAGSADSAAVLLELRAQGFLSDSTRYKTRGDLLPIFRQGPKQKYNTFGTATTVKFLRKHDQIRAADIDIAGFTRSSKTAWVRATDPISGETACLRAPANSTKMFRTAKCPASVKWTRAVKSAF